MCGTSHAAKTGERIVVTGAISPAVQVLSLWVPSIPVLFVQVRDTEP